MTKSNLKLKIFRITNFEVTIAYQAVFQYFITYSDLYLLTDVFNMDPDQETSALPKDFGYGLGYDVTDKSALLRSNLKS